jgi:hypothetical protein
MNCCPSGKSAAHGQNLSASELCRRHSELLPELQRRLAAVRQVHGSNK